VHVARLRLAPDVDLEAVAGMTPGLRRTSAFLPLPLRSRA
jgi:hypothetical protein